ncbi:MAG: ABC transporter ATP-binding protein [Candidatus Bathyarchaeia archaeon]
MSLIEVREITKHFPVRKGFLSRDQRVVHAVDAVDMNIHAEETLALVGESGCGKTTLGRLVLRLIEPTSGTIRLEGEEITSFNHRQMQSIRPKMQMIFQDPTASLNPRKTIRQILSDPLLVHERCDKDELEERATELLEMVQLTPPSMYLNRYPHEFSGGQRQRIVIARAIALWPRFIFADEPVASLDVSVRGGILKLMQALQDRLSISYLFVTHDLSVVRSISHRVAIMYLGQIVERAETNRLFEAPKHPYTNAILSATPIPNPQRARMRSRIILQGDLPSPINPPAGCRFHTRCPQAKHVCAQEQPPTVETETGHTVACWLYA